MERVIFRHLSGSKANQIEEFVQFHEIVIGRDPAADIRYDPERDDLVGRRHAKITRDEADRYRFTVTDLNSRNGTFVNRQRILSSATIEPGDVLQFGPGGPELRFEIDPLPAEFIKRTRVAVPEVGTTRMAADAGPAGLSRHPAVEPAGAVEAVPRQRLPIGKQTVERLVSQARRDTKSILIKAMGAAAVVVAAIIGTLAWRDARENARLRDEAAQGAVAAIKAEQPWTPQQVAATYADATVFIEVGWKLIETGTGRQVYHEYYVQEKDGRPVKDERGQVKAVPLYLRLPDGTIEPALTQEIGKYEQNQPIGSNHTGSGFVVTGDGFILTNRHVAASWETAYRSLPPGLLYDLQTRKVERLEDPPRTWVPASSRLLGRRAVTGKNIEGRLDYLDVTFAKNKLRVPAKLVRVSDRHDAALVKVDLPQRLPSVPLYDNYEQVQAGMAVTVMGYPAISPDVAVVSRSFDPFARDAQVRTVPEPTVTPGIIGRVVRGALKPVGGTEQDYLSTFGDSYQLTINATGGGNSGGPVFDERGRVIAIYYATRNDEGGARISFAVPIRYGSELMGTAPAVH